MATAGQDEAIAAAVAASEADLLAAMRVPATFVDRFYMTINADRVRIAFGEETSAGTCYSMALAMSAESAVQLIELLGQFVGRAPPVAEPPTDTSPKAPTDV